MRVQIMRRSMVFQLQWKPAKIYIYLFIRLFVSVCVCVCVCVCVVVCVCVCVLENCILIGNFVKNAIYDTLLLSKVKICFYGFIAIRNIITFYQRSAAFSSGNCFLLFFFSFFSTSSNSSLQFFYHSIPGNSFFISSFLYLFYSFISFIYIPATFF